MESMSINFHEPQSAKCEVYYTAGGFSSLRIGSHPLELNIIVGGTSSTNLHFLYALRDAVEKAFQFELGR